MSNDNSAWFSTDLNGDGQADISIDTADMNRDGVADSLGIEANVFGGPASHLNFSLGDSDRDGSNDVALLLDFDGDGMVDAAISVADQTGDWWPDSIEAQADFNGDGRAEISARAHDVTADLFPDLAELKLDLNSDGLDDFDIGVVDVGVPLPVPGSVIEQLWADSGTRSDLIATFPENSFAHLDSSLAGFAAPEMLGRLTEIHGTPESDLQLWDMQDGPASCAVASTSMVLRSIGVDASEAALAEAFERFGIYDPIAGTRPDLIDEVVNFLSARDGLDIHANEMRDFTANDLTQMLDSGARPLVGLDAAELYPDTFGLVDRGLEQLE